MATNSVEPAKKPVFHAELYLADGTLLANTELPRGSAPDVIFCGARAFRRVLRVRGGLQYTECSCWRIEDPTPQEAGHGG